MYPFHARTAQPISTKFCTDLTANSGKVLGTSITPPTRPLDPRVPQTQKPLCNVTCPDGRFNFTKFFPGSARARLASLSIHKNISIQKRLFVPMSLFHAQPAQPISTKFCTDLNTNSGKVLNTCMTPPTQPPNPRVPQTPKP